MKKLITFVVVLFVSVSVLAPNANAVVAPNGLANQCCDVNGYPRCVIPWIPAGGSCFCYGIPGNGYAC